MIRYEVSESHYVTRRERLDDALILGREDTTVFERLHECVDVVYFVDLSAREVEDNGSLVVVGVSDIGDFAISQTL